MEVRDADASELSLLARIWHDGWQDAHAEILPAELARRRTLKRFRERLEGALATVRVAGPPGAPLGFCMVRGDELYQLYVAVAARGTGVAGDLIVDAEARMWERKIGTAWLACAIGNYRAARFYEKQGWHRAGNMVSQLNTPEGMFPLEVWRYEKSLTEPARG